MILQFCLTIHLLKSIWVVPNFWLLWKNYYELLCRCMFSLLLSICLGVGFLGRVRTLYLLLWGAADCPPERLHHCILPWVKQEGPPSPHTCQHVLWFASLTIVTLTGVTCSPVVALISISLRAGDSEHFSMCLLAICRSCLESCLFRSNVQF